MGAPSSFSAVSICSRAYDAIEHRGFEDFADGSDEGAFAARHWDAARRHVLAAVPWAFATAYGRADAALAGQAAPAETPFVVGLAPDCLFFRGLTDIVGAQARPFGDRLLRTDAVPPFVYEYTADVTEMHRWTPGAVEALVLYLAHLFAPKWTRSQNRAEILFQRFEQQLAEAAATDARQGDLADHRDMSGGAVAGSWTGYASRAP